MARSQYFGKEFLAAAAVCFVAVTLFAAGCVAALAPDHVHNHTITLEEPGCNCGGHEALTTAPAPKPVANGKAESQTDENPAHDFVSLRQANLVSVLDGPIDVHSDPPAGNGVHRWSVSFARAHL